MVDSPEEPAPKSDAGAVAPALQRALLALLEHERQTAEGSQERLLELKALLEAELGLVANGLARLTPVREALDLTQAAARLRDSLGRQGLAGSAQDSRALLVDNAAQFIDQRDFGAVPSRRDFEMARRHAQSMGLRLKAWVSSGAWSTDGLMPRTWRPSTSFEPELVQAISCCYENLDLALSILLLQPGVIELVAPPEMADLKLLAAAQSAIFAKLLEKGAEQDPAQNQTYKWIRFCLDQHGLSLKAHLREGSFVRVEDHGRWRAKLDERLHRLRTEELLGSGQEAALAHLLEARADLDRDPSRRQAALAKVLRSVGEWLLAGGKETHPKVCDALAGVLRYCPPGWKVEAKVARVFEAAEERAALIGVETAEPEAPQSEPSAETREAAKLLQGLSVLLIGGNANREACERLKGAWGIQDLHWVETIAHRSLAPLEGEIKKRGVDLVIIFTRWSDHAFQELKQVAESADRLFVKAPAGYGTNRLSHDILEQVGVALRTRRATT